MSERAKPWSKRPRLPRGHVRMTEHTGGAWFLRVPAQLGRLIGDERVFTPELVEEGLLFRYVDGGEPVSLPSWLTGK